MAQHEKKLKGKITISRPQGRTGSCAAISITDELSGIRFVEMEFNLSDFAEALLGVAYVEGEMEVRGLDKVGMKREHKTMKVFLPKKYEQIKCDDAAYEAVLKPYETGGWVGSIYDLKNRKRKIYADATEDGADYNVSFTRWVEVTGEEDDVP